MNKIGTLDAVITVNLTIGNDLVFLPDFKASFNELFKKKVYTLNEIAYCDQFDNSILRYASTWAAKEAVYKALKQIDSQPLAFKNIEIIRDKIAGKPVVNLLKYPNQLSISLSISHDSDYVWAVALLNSSC